MGVGGSVVLLIFYTGVVYTRFVLTPEIMWIEPPVVIGRYQSRLDAMTMPTTILPQQVGNWLSDVY